jgi:hypothetical protein
MNPISTGAYKLRCLLPCQPRQLWNEVRNRAVRALMLRDGIERFTAVVAEESHAHKHEDGEGCRPHSKRDRLIEGGSRLFAIGQLFALVAAGAREKLQFNDRDDCGLAQRNPRPQVVSRR